jgi:SMI1 / KNR4 family (SUKH-1)
MLPQRKQLKPFQRLQRYWIDSGANIQTTAISEDAVAALERRYGVALPNDFREYLLKSCPQGNDNGWPVEWWSLDRIKNIPEEYEYKIENASVARSAGPYLFFADYMIWCWAWAIACGNDENRGRVVVIGASDNFIADSFGQFVDRYIDDELSVVI